VRVGRRTGVLVLVAAVLVCSAAPHYFCTRPETHCDLPNRCYAYKIFSPLKTAKSLPLAWLELDPQGVIKPAANPPQVDPPQLAPDRILFQFSNPPLVTDHCSVSELAVEVDKGGDIVVSLLAKQNPLTVSPLSLAPNLSTTQPQSKVTAQLRRNQFYITLRFYGQSTATQPPSALGQPMLAKIEVPAFWVERGQPYYLRHECHCGDIANSYPLISQVELDFKYRLADYEKAPLP
jgi:hypothetical protein